MNWLRKNTRLVVWGFLLGLIIFFYAVLFNARREWLVADSGLADPTIDAWLFYTPGQLADTLPRFSESGRQVYALTEFTLDLVFPFIYGTWLYLGLAALSGVLFSAGSRWRWLRFAPALMVAADLLENTFLTANFLSYPPVHNQLAALAAGASAAKWVLGIICVVLLAVGGLAWLVKALVQRRG